VPEPRVAEALRRGGLIDITTTGRRTGRPRRIEIVFFGIDGRVYITGSPGSRGWLANLQADPRLTFHLKRGVVADLPATARIVTDPVERRMVVETACRAWNRLDDMDAFAAGSPVIEIVLDEEGLSLAN
jgi:deazaflavin-dependent oxidoreductase (nitroreductase family)